MRSQQIYSRAEREMNVRFMTEWPLFPTDAHVQILTASHWRGLMSVALLLGAAWMNLSRLPVASPNSPSTGYLLLMLLVLALVPAATATLRLYYRSHLRWGTAADWTAMGATALLLIMSIGGFLTDRAYGTPTAVPWGVNVSGIIRHPVQLYHAATMGITLLVLWRLRGRLLSGETFWRFILFYSLSQLILADFCADAITWGPGIRVEQTLALAMLLGSMYVLSCYANRRAQAAPGADGDSYPRLRVSQQESDL